MKAEVKMLVSIETWFNYDTRGPIIITVGEDTVNPILLCVDLIFRESSGIIQEWKPQPSRIPQKTSHSI